jgi:6-pyruvoyl-tetrahydropterin synthase
MRHLLIALSSVCLIGLASCTKVISVDLNSSNPQYVVEGSITNDGSVQTVHITRSVNYSGNNSYPAVTNALVIITDGSSIGDTLIQNTPGFYETNKLQGIPGHTYSLRVIVDGQELSAESTMPLPVPFDSLALIKESTFGKEIRTPVIGFSDPAGIHNYYNFIVFKNDKRSKTLYLDFDVVKDGVQVVEFLRDYDTTYNVGDKLSVEMQCIPQPMYDYYASLKLTTEQTSATPANPISNIRGKNVLGYFSAHTSQQRSLVAQ